MPYENSVIANGKLIKGNLGYFQWLKNITMNLMFDRDFLIRRYKEKIIIEKQEFQKCLNEHEKYKHDKYYVIRSGYYYVTSILQLSRIQKFEKVFFSKIIFTFFSVSLTEYFFSITSFASSIICFSSDNARRVLACP